MPTLNRGLLAARRSYAFLIAQISAHPATAFWLIVAYLVIRR